MLTVMKICNGQIDGMCDFDGYVGSLELKATKIRKGQVDSVHDFGSYDRMQDMGVLRPHWQSV